MILVARVTRRATPEKKARTLAHPRDFPDSIKKGALRITNTILGGFPLKASFKVSI